MKLEKFPAQRECGSYVETGILFYLLAAWWSQKLLFDWKGWKNASKRSCNQVGLYYKLQV